MSYLRSGIFLAPFHALGENPTLALERDMELLQHLDKLNYHEAWIGEHHSGGFEIIGSPEVFITAAAERTKHIRLGTGVSSLPYHHPMMLADRMNQLDHMTRGRVMFGCGPGALVSDAMMMGIPPQAQRDRMIARFQAEGESPPVFILSLKAGGTGLNLTRANHVFHFDRWWNPAVENQATDRAFRIGQTRNVQVHKFLCVGTLEEKIDEMIERKQQVAQWVVGTGEGWLTELSNDDLREVFALRPTAVGE